MKLIAKRDFFAADNLGVKLAKESEADSPAKNHIHLGARFSIGTAEKFDDLSKSDQGIVARLISDGAVVFDDEENRKKGVIDRIDKAAKAAKDQLAKAGEAVQTTEEKVAVAVVATLAKLGVIKIPGAQPEKPAEAPKK